MNVETERPGLRTRMAAVMAAVRGVAKSEFNPHGKYKYAGHEQVTAALRDEYVRHGIIRSASVIEYSRTADGTLQLFVEVSWENVDNAADVHRVRVLGEAPTTTTSGKATGQQAGIAFSYAVKMAELKQFSLTGDDTPNPEAGDKETEQAEDFIARFDACETAAEVEALSAEVKAAGSLRATGGAAMLKARTDAIKRTAGK